MSKCDLCGKLNSKNPVVRTLTTITIGEGDDREDYHQIIICVNCIRKLYREHIIAPHNHTILEVIGKGGASP